uniref:Uncharacterized protein n=1 Tax=Helicotheca tamesis TaxID=374047 RepID=A0A7S2III9_9STRA|eukprot:CAMPEP_0185723418 /NCGR_PEP_ID=MMETSP1171-20130828/267_1 /TAXON_ID=374046 /ORGANISM="Helicotheca tamensis, Strain CCMP826" /LENGTH=168 /DNA_ID=CAMNT_0028391117 /DNA_START=66 /DNA_END=572 /DNA_ORIENTATION=+
MISPSSLRRWMFLVLCMLAVALSSTKADNVSSNPWGMVKQAVEPLQEKYIDLPPKGKFASGAFVGFAASRMTVKAVVKGMKITGAFYIASEVLDYTGFLHMPEMSEETEQALEKLMTVAKRFINEWRIKVRHYLNPDNIKVHYKKALDRDSMTTMGVTVGAFFGFLLG